MKPRTKKAKKFRAIINERFFFFGELGGLGGEKGSL
jgi:hypothetical protein